MKDQRLSTRLGQYIKQVLPDAHGHQHKAFVDFAAALVVAGSCCQASMARTFTSFEAAAKRLSRFLGNERIDPDEVSLSTLEYVAFQLRWASAVRLVIDWTVEDRQHLLVASLVVGGRAVPIFWRAYGADELKGRTREYEERLIGEVLDSIVANIDASRVTVTADRAFATASHFDLLDSYGVGFVIRSKGSVTVWFSGQWHKLSSLRFTGNQRRRVLGRIAYCQSDPRQLWVCQARARDRCGNWGVWHMVSNHAFSAEEFVYEYRRRFNCEHAFRDGKRLLGFADARIADISAWSRMFA